MVSIVESVRRLVEWLRNQNDIRRGAIMGIGFGLLLCVIIFISILLVNYAGTFGK